MSSSSLPQIFNYQDHEVRTLEIDGVPWLVATDVCKILEITRVDSALRSLDNDEKGTHIMSTLGGDQNVLIVSESGIYHLVFRSRKPEAKVFRRWVTGTVLPEIRKTGSYSLAPAQEPVDPIVLFDDKKLLRGTIEDLQDKRLAISKMIHFLEFGEDLRYPQEQRRRGQRRLPKAKISRLAEEDKSVYQQVLFEM